MYFLLEKVDSHCYVNLPEGNQLYSSVSYVNVSCAAVWSPHILTHPKPHVFGNPCSYIPPPSRSEFAKHWNICCFRNPGDWRPPATSNEVSRVFQVFQKQINKNFIKMDGFSCPMWRKSVWLIRWFLLPFFEQQEVPFASHAAVRLCGLW